PVKITVPGVPQVSMRDLLETACRVEAPGELVSEGYIVDKAVCVRRADGLLVEAHGIEVAALNSRELGSDQCGAVLEILRTILRPYFELSMMFSQSFKMVPLPLGKCGIAGRCMRKRTIEVILRRFKD